MAVPRLTISHGTRERTVCSTLSARLSSPTPAKRLHVLFGLVLNDLDDVVDGDDADEAVVLVDDRRRHQVVALELAGHLLLVGGREHEWRSVSMIAETLISRLVRSRRERSTDPSTR